MIDFRKGVEGKDIVVVYPGQDISMVRHRDASRPDESPGYHFLLIEVYNDDHIILSGELINYISNLVEEKKEVEENCAKYRKICFDLLNKTEK